ncbi:MAG: cytochrome c-type biogenesis protein CcmH [Gemmatimonadales bacterium]
MANNERNPVTRPDVGRRRFLGLVAGTAALALGRRLAAQDTAQARGAADPLMDPSIVGQTRAEVTDLDNAEIIKNIERGLKCTCGCNLDIFTCRTTDFTCTYSPELHREIVGLYTGGQTPDQIVATFVQKYGEQILLAPDARGFNLLGYLLPGAAVLAGAGTLGYFLLRRHRQQLFAAAGGGPVAAAPSGGLDDAERRQLEAALGELDQ